MSGAACCGGARARLAPFDCFQRGLRTRRMAPLPLAGPRIHAARAPALWAAFSVRVEAGRIAALGFSCASCTTLIACCQALAELNGGCPLEAPCVADGVALWSALPGLAIDKRDRADLAAAALRAALAGARAEPIIHQEEA